MLIKTIKNRTESDWFQLTKRLHRELIEEAPDSVLVHIEDIYPTAPERGTLIELNFDLFTTLVRELALEELRQQKAMSVTGTPQESRALTGPAAIC